MDKTGTRLVVLGLFFVAGLVFFGKISPISQDDWQKDNGWTDSNFPNGLIPSPPVPPVDPVNPNLPQVPETVPVPQTYQEALTISRQYNRPILMMFTMRSCGHCIRMKQETLKDPQVLAAINSNFIYLEIDAQKERNLTMKYSVQGVPCYKIINADEQVLNTGAGYQNSNNFIRWLTGR